MRLRSLFMIVLALLMIAPMTYAQEPAALSGTQWQLVSIAGEDVLGGSSITLTFGEDNSAGGSGGCNSYGSTYTLTDAGGITFTEVVSTMMACLENAVMEQETTYLAALQAATVYQIIDDQLVITYGEGETLVFEPAPTLPDTQWRLVSMGEEPVIEGSEVTLGFDNEGNVTGSGGCNQFGSTYSLDSQTLTFGEIVTTEMACLEEGLMEQEAAYYAALAAATSYTLAGDTLTILYGEEDAALVLERVLNLANTAWHLESINDTPVNVAVTLQFDDAGGAAGDGACNQYSSTYTLTGSEISFDAIISTRMACEDAVMQVESAYFAALEAAERIELHGERLTITTADGETLVFVASETISSRP